MVEILKHYRGIGKRNISRKLMLFVAGASAISMTAPAHAQVTPFTCSGEIYQVQSGQLRVFNPIISQYEDVGTNQGSYNATGYNVQDNFAYGSQGNNVIRIGANGDTEVAFDIGTGSFAGDVDDSNNYWLRGNSQNQLRRINLATGALTVFDVTGITNGGADFMFIRDGGIPHLLVVGNGRVGIINLNTFVSTRPNVSGLPGGGYGAQWTDFNGRVFAFRNSDGRIYELFNIFSSNPSAVIAAQGDPSGNNDGFSCPDAPFPNLPPVAFDDDFTTPFETAINRNVVSRNNNDADFDPESSPVTVDTTPIAGPSNGTVTLAANGDFTYTPNNGFFGVDSFEYRISDVTGLTATASVTITVPAPPIDLVTVKTLASGNANPTAGDVVTFEITVTNNGPADATGVTLNDTIPAGLDATANNGNVTLGSYASGVWTIGTLANGASATLTIEGVVNASVAGQPVTNTTTQATGDQNDPTDTGNDLMESIIIFPRSLAPNSDTSDDIISSIGSTNALNVFDGDTLAGLPATPSNTSVTVDASSALPPELTFDTATGVVGVLPGTAPGPYSFIYQICEIANPVNCETATATVNVVDNPIDAVNDEVSGIVGVVGGNSVLNVFSGDTVGADPATSANVILSVDANSSVPNEITFNVSNGDIDVPAGTPAGQYSFDYMICETAAPTNCDSATATVIVVPAIIAANVDNLPAVLGDTGSNNAGNAFANDLLAGTAVDAADINANVTMPAIPLAAGANVPSLNSVTGQVTVPIGTPAGNYMIEYRICELINPTNCAITQVNIEVLAASVTAVDDREDDLDGIAGQAPALNVLNGDMIGASAATISNSILSLAAGSSVPNELLFDPATGEVDLLPDSLAGIYMFDYQICEALNPTNCDIATATITVRISADLSITKTNTPGVNSDVDQSDDTLLFGASTTYVLTVTNNGPDSVNGAVITDTPSAGLNCIGGDAVNISGDGVPVGTFTISDLTGAGIVTGQLDDAQTITLSYSCTVI